MGNNPYRKRDQPPAPMLGNAGEQSPLLAPGLLRKRVIAYVALSLTSSHVNVPFLAGSCNPIGRDMVRPTLSREQSHPLCL
jgi:hypothetical protein